MRNLPFYEVKNIWHPENSDKDVIILTDGRVMVYELVSRDAFREIQKRCDDEIVGYLTRGSDRECVYTIFEIFCELTQFITPDFYPPRDDS